ncbi:MAG: hypothetical protein IT566_18250 [Rhodospirillaceae bacterium]|nr:hypothetical protein [Rhodospirillaceae bacterium]
MTEMTRAAATSPTMLRDQPNIQHVTQEFRGEKDGSFTPFWVVTTPLILDALHPAYDLESVSSLINAVQEHCRKQPELLGRIIIRESVTPGRNTPHK